jgi:hypothetical protein
VPQGHAHRWSVTGAEAVLRLRALRTSGDFDDYWAFASPRSMSGLINHAMPKALLPTAAIASPCAETRQVIETAPVERGVKEPHPSRFMGAEFRGEAGGPANELMATALALPPTKPRWHYWAP